MALARGPIATAACADRPGVGARFRSSPGSHSVTPSAPWRWSGSSSSMPAVVMVSAESDELRGVSVSAATRTDRAHGRDRAHPRVGGDRRTRVRVCSSWRCRGRRRTQGSSRWWARGWRRSSCSRTVLTARRSWAPLAIGVMADRDRRRCARLRRQRVLHHRARTMAPSPGSRRSRRSTPSPRCCWRG